MLLWPLAALALDQLGARRPHPNGRAFDAIVVAGSSVEPDGTPGLALRARTRVAVQLWRAGAAPLVFFTGSERYDTTEARSALQWALRLGLPAEAADLEELSTSTEENAYFAARALGREAAILVVTDTYHLPRTIDVFRFYFEFVDGVASRSPLHNRAHGALREPVAVLHYLTLGKLRRRALTRQMSTDVHDGGSRPRPSRRERWLFTAD
ncbi:MAG: YdcF family protein [Myxococcales bacterium]|nr:YdcF family protein [Myxococcales bacterium]